MIAPFQCGRCNAPLAVVDAPTLVCRYCGNVNEVPLSYRKELRLVRDLDRTTRQALDEWKRLDNIKVPRWWFIGTATLPFLLLAAGLALVLTFGMLRTVRVSVLPSLAALLIWIPLIPVSLLASKVGMRNLLVSGAARVGVSFAAIPSKLADGDLNCRQCAAPLTVETDDILVRCIYCGAESIVRFDESQMQSLTTNVGTAKMSLAQAMMALSKRANLVVVETRGRLGVIAGLLVMPLVWSLVPTVQTSYWSLLIALDVWVLSICVFWISREAFLPPVTIEELDAIWHSLTENSSSSAEDLTQHPITERPAGTRGWYDQSSARVNFLVPLLVTLMFVAIEVLVLMNR